MPDSPWRKIGKANSHRRGDEPNPLVERLAFVVIPPEASKPVNTVRTRPPKVRLSHRRPSHFRMIEILRLLRAQTACDPATTTNALELARRGVLDRVDHFRWTRGRIIVSMGAANIIRKSCEELLMLGLVGKLHGGGRIPAYAINKDGLETLADWDDPTADGAY